MLFIKQNKLLVKKLLADGKVVPIISSGLIARPCNQSQRNTYM